MKSLIVGILCLFLILPCYALDFSEVGREAAERTNNELEEEILDVLDTDEIRWLLRSQRDLNHMQYLIEEVRRKADTQSRLNTMGHLFGGLFKIGIGYWGFTQDSMYGNVTGVLFGLSGTVQLINLSW